MSEPHYIVIERALRRLAESQVDQPSLAELAAEAGLSEFHFQRVFKEWVGISPKKFLQHLTLNAAKERLQESMSVLDAAYDVGLSGPSRLHDLFVGLEAMTPGEYKRRGGGLTIRYGFHDSPFGECLVAMTEQGVCGLNFVMDDDRATSLADITRRWPAAAFREDGAVTAGPVARIFPSSPARQGALKLSLIVPGTPFQLRVWRALLEVPPGHLVTYGHLASRLGYARGGAQAIGQAVSANPISWIIPCHRVIRETGAINGYYWGVERKLAMIGWEASMMDAPRAGRQLSAGVSAGR